MPLDQSRFRVPSDELRLSRLLKTYRATIWGLAIALVSSSGGIAYFIVVAKERAAPQPAVTRLIIRKPKSTKPFALKRQRLRPRAMTKQVTAVKPRLAAPTTRRLPGASVFGRIETFEYAVEADVQIDLQTTPIELSAARVKGTKEPEKRIAMREELLDLDALDTGKYKGLIIQDPTDKKNVKGFVYLGTAWATDLEPIFDSAAKAMPNLVDALNEQTGITAKIDEHLFLDSQELFRTPFVYITANEAFELTEREIHNLGAYLRSGGFIFVDNATPTLEFSQAEASLRQIFRDALGAQGTLRAHSQYASHLPHVLRFRRSARRFGIAGRLLCRSARPEFPDYCRVGVQPRGDFLGQPLGGNLFGQGIRAQLGSVVRQRAAIALWHQCRYFRPHPRGIHRPAANRLLQSGQ